MTKNSPQGAAMDNSQHTQGPWSMSLSRPGTSFLVRDAEKRLVCEMSWHSSSREFFPLRGESEANARLIAAAPELLAALQNLVGGWPAGEGMALGERIKQARAAIAAATGSTHE